MDNNIIKATKNDAKTLERIFSIFYRAELKWSKDKIIDKMRQGREYYIIVENGAIELKFENMKCELVAIATNPQRRGRGSQLVQFAENLARERNCKKIWCYTLEVNQASEFYRKMGWIKEEFIPDFFDGYGCFKFGKELKQNGRQIS